MKRIYALMLSSLLAGVSMELKAQFFEQTSYVGAFGTENWMAGWTSFSPKTNPYPAVTNSTTLVNDLGTVTNLGANIISGNVTLDASQVYELRGVVYIASGGVLTIPAGTIIRGSNVGTGGTLVVQRGGQLFVNGTVSAPVVFTSIAGPGARNPEDWGGIVILGRGANNRPGGVQIIEGGFNASTGEHGGGLTPNDVDNSGSITYCRIEFAGYDFATNNEINSLTLGSVGSGTTLNYIQTSFGGDDAYEWFSGAVNAKHLVSYATSDDDFDTDNGFKGKIQFGVCIKDPALYDLSYTLPSGASTSEGFESDNDATGTAAKPTTLAVFSNITAIGPISDPANFASLPATTRDAFRRGARIRRGSGQSILNSIFLGYRAGLMLDGNAALNSSPNKALLSDTLQYRNNIQGGMQSFTEVASSGSPFTAAQVLTWVQTPSFGNRLLASSSNILTDPFNLTNPNLLPIAGSPALTGADFSSFFEQTSYVGAFGTENWMAGWTSFSPKTNAYPAVTNSVTLVNDLGTVTNLGSNVISGNVTLDASQVYELRGVVYIASGGVLTIPAGTVIRGSNVGTGGTLVVQRGGQLFVNGTVSAPVVFTSIAGPGARNPEDWGGIVILGRGANNRPGGVQIIEGGFNASTGEHGGGLTPNDVDNSGSITYCRIEFAGYDFATNNEINSLTLGSVGSGTRLDYIQTSFGGDDAYEWFSGAVNAKHLVSYATSDDDFDTDNGFKGRIQFGVAIKDPALYDLSYTLPSGASTSEGFESDNDATGSAAKPTTLAVFSNMTMVGPIADPATFASLPATTRDAFRRGARIRRGSGQSIMNSIFLGYRAGLMLDGNAALNSSPNKALLSDTLQYRNNIQGGMQSFTEVASSGSPFTAAQVLTWVQTPSYGNRLLAASSGILADPFNLVAPNLLPVAGSAALTGADFSSPVFQSKFDEVNSFISGRYSYDNAGSSPLDSITVQLKDVATNTIVATTQTDVNGNYSFNNLELKQYELFATSTSPWFGPTSIDVLQIRQAIAQTRVFTPLRLKAADVNASNTLLSGDALQLSRRIAGTLSSFAAGDWAFLRDTLSLSTEETNGNNRGLIVGDVNGSTGGPFRVAKSVNLSKEGIKAINSNEEFSYPVYINSSADVNAITVFANFPSDLLEVKSIVIPGDETNSVIYNVIGNEIRIVWAELASLKLKANDVLFVINFKSKNISKNSVEKLEIKLSNATELGDVNAEIIQNVELSSARLVMNSNGYSSAIFPNPVNDLASINYSVKEDSKVTISMFDLVGKKVATIVDVSVTAGQHVATLDVKGFSAGTYFYTINVQGSTSSYNNVEKFIIK